MTYILPTYPTGTIGLGGRGIVWGGGGWVGGFQHGEIIVMP